MIPRILLSLLVLFSGCAYVEPIVGDFNIISPAQEAQIGTQVQSQVGSQMKIITGTEEARKVSEIGNRLVNVLPRRDYSYKFYVVENDEPNAFTIPGGTIYVHTGLLKFADDDELAGVIGHEIGHAYDRHPAKAMSRQYGAEYLGKMLFKQNQGQLQQLTYRMAQQTLLLRYSRNEEFKADEIGYNLLSRSGYRTDGLVRFFKKLQAASGGGGGFSFMSTHPPTPERIARLQALEAAIRIGNVPPIS